MTLDKIEARDAAADTPSSGARERLENVARAIDPSWWAWSDLHYDPTIPGDVAGRNGRLEVASRAITAADAMRPPPPSVDIGGLREKAKDATCCGGLAFPKLPYLHAEACPRRQDAVTFFREDPDERRMFDQATEVWGGDPLQNVINTLDGYGRANPYPGSFARNLFILANEVLIAKSQRDTLLDIAERAEGEKRDAFNQGWEAAGTGYGPNDIEGAWRGHLNGVRYGGGDE